MKKKRIVYTDEPMGRMQIIPNFLPPPDQLVLREEGSTGNARPGQAKPRTGRRKEKK